MIVLLIEDNEDDAELIREALSPHASHSITLEWADRLETGFSKLARRSVDAVLLDLSLPDSHGLNTLDRARTQIHDAPVIVLTGLDDERVAEEALRHGAQDYLVKGRLDGDLLRRAIRYAMGRHQVEQALRKSEERFQLACRATNDGIWDWDIGADAVWRNDAYEAVFGDHARGKSQNLATWSERIHPDERASVVADLTDTLRSDRRFWTGEYRFRRADGTYVYVIDRGYVIRDHEGAPRRMIGAMNDVTDRRQLETFQAAQLAVSLALDESPALGDALPKILRALCEVNRWTLGAFWMVNPQGKILQCETLWHRPDFQAEEFIRQYRSLQLSPDMGLAGQAWETGEPVLRPDIRQDPDVPMAHALSCLGLRSGIAFPIRKGKVILGIMEFLTLDILRPSAAQIHMVAELGTRVSQFIQDKDVERQLRQGQKMEALGRMAGGIAHDFNNLLTVINSWSEILLTESTLNPRTNQGLNQIREAGNKAASLTRQLLAFSRHQLVRQQILNLNDRVTDIVDLMRRVIGEDINLIVTLDPTVGPIHADPGQIEQVVMNLVVNARDAMPQGGRLELETKEQQITQSDSSWPDSIRPGPYVTLAVRDTGCGMDAETLAHVFEPFFSTKDRGKGTGLGLSTVYGIVKQSGGTIGVESVPGQGTTFMIYFPRADGRQAAPLTPPPRPDRPQGTETILLVEDDEMVHSLAHTVLAAQQYAVMSARNAQEALSIARTHAGHIALLVTDMVMPGMTGSQLAIQMKRLRPDIKIIMTSGYADREKEFLASFGPTAAFLQKPYTPDSLTSKVREILDAPPPPPTPDQP
ncbi:MAG: hypothetical protein OJF47_004266 [Nitrospira sp.]|jgi:PAS domain S-box-containing protein|nr:MAG: hypothetical protein OJF47_004266 [Nitrospira sp.]